MIHTYAGIGSRDITDTENSTIVRLASLLQKRGYVLYSGNADGADIAFQYGCNGFGVSFLPWIGFNQHLHSKVIKCHNITTDAYASVDMFHPAPEKLSKAARTLMARNYHQIHGIYNLPRVDFVVCCATIKGDEVTGGTGQAVRIAKSLGIPVINLRDPLWEGYVRLIPRIDPPKMEDILDLYCI